MAFVEVPGEIRHIAINADTATGDNALVAAAGANNQIRVLSYVLSGFGTTNDVTARFESGAGGTALTGIMNVYDGTGTMGKVIVCPHNPYGWFETAANTALSLEVAGTDGEVDGHMTVQIFRNTTP